ncbi:MAG TPA: type II secretory protein PulD [Bryocella sp.]|nr:type II secretory protein PulD [Bryocella sp.]
MRLYRSRRSLRHGPILLPLCGMVVLTLAGMQARGQTNADTPASVPAGADAAVAAGPQPTIAVTSDVPAKQVREAEDAYLQGAKAVDHKDLEAAVKSFARAVQLNPKNRDYTLALMVTREHRLSELVQLAAKDRLLSKDQQAEQLLEEARKIDPNNAIVAQHFESPARPAVSELPAANSVANSLGGPVELAPKSGKQDVHLRGGATDVLRSLYAQFGITASFDASVRSEFPVKLELEGVTFGEAARIASEMTHTFAVALQSHTALIAEDTQDNRRRLKPVVEETLYMPGLQETQMQEMANLARALFDLPLVTASPSTDTIVVHGDPENLKVLNATYEGLLNGDSDVMLDVKLYEIDRSHTRNLGFELPTSIGAFSVAQEAQQLVSQNQSLVNQAIASGVIKLTGNTLTDLLTETAFLIGSGVVNVAQYSNLLGVVGKGLGLAGVYIGSGATLNLLLNSSDVRTLDAVQLRSGTNQDATFRAGERYPIITSTYTSGVSNAAASAVSGLNINGTSVGSLLQQYLGTSSVTVPQVQFEDLGLTLKATPVILRTGSVQLKLDMKIESLGAGSFNAIPVLNSRQLTSIATIPAGQTALLVSEISRSETRAVQGLPGLSELPGFQSTTDENKEVDTGELLITITPHIVREGGVRIASRPLLMPYNPNPSAQSFFQQQLRPPPPPPPQQLRPQTPGSIPPRNMPPPGATVPIQPITPAPQ